MTTPDKRNSEFYTDIQTQYPLSIFIEHLKRLIFKKITKKSTNLFLCAKDIISIEPITNGVHEPALTSLIDSLSEKGYSDFLIDIGANIGLICCQSGNQFSEVHIYEPNPLCCHILAVNTSIALTTPIFEIHQFGLGSEQKVVELVVPKHNWGGAFVKDSYNSYDEKVLAAKDGFDKIDPRNYTTIKISIKDTATELKQLFERLSAKNLTRGVIKIDVEGYEQEVLRGIACSIPKSFSAFIVFESWDKNFPINKVTAEFQREVEVGKITRMNPWKPNWPKPLKALLLLFSRKVLTQVSPAKEGDMSGEIILHIK